MSKHVARVAQPRARSRKTPALPPMLAAIVMLVDDEANERQLDLVARALAHVRKVNHRPGSLEDAAWQFIDQEATVGPWRELDLALKSGDKVLTSPDFAPGNRIGALHCLYGIPGIAVGLAIAYHVLADRGGER